MTPYAPTQRARSPRAARIVSIAVAAAAVLAASVVPAGAATYSITPGGPSVVVTVSTAGGSSRANFSGTAGQRVAVRATNTSILAGQIRLQDSSGTILRTSGLNTGGAWLDMVTLPADDTYSIVVDASSTHTGSTTVTLYNEPADPTAALTSGTPRMLTTTTPGQNASYTFNGTAGWNLSLAALQRLDADPERHRQEPRRHDAHAGPRGRREQVDRAARPGADRHLHDQDRPAVVREGQPDPDRLDLPRRPDGEHRPPTARPTRSTSRRPARTARSTSRRRTATGSRSRSRASPASLGKMWIKNPDGTVLVPTQTLTGGGVMVEPHRASARPAATTSS